MINQLSESNILNADWECLMEKCVAAWQRLKVVAELQ